MLVSRLPRHLVELCDRRFTGANSCTASCSSAPTAVCDALHQQIGDTVARLKARTTPQQCIYTQKQLVCALPGWVG